MLKYENRVNRRLHVANKLLVAALVGLVRAARVEFLGSLYGLSRFTALHKVLSLPI